MSTEVKGRTAAAGWSSTQAYVMAVICLLIGVAVGYFLRGSATGSGQPTVASVPAGMPQMGQQVTPEQLKHMADKQVEPMLAQLKSSPNDPALLANIGNVYYDAQQYRDAISYYDRSLKLDPKNANVRTDMGTAYYYLGDADAALREFATALQNDPQHVQTMFNMGMVQWQAKGDAKAAIASWDKLLKTAPDYPERAKVEQLISQAKQHTNIPPGTRTTKPTS